MNRIRIILLSLLCSFQLAAQQVLTLDQALELAVKENFDIQLSNKQLAEKQINNTLGNAGMLPTASIEGLSSIGNSQMASASLELNWTLFNGGRMFVTKDKLNQLVRLGELQFKEQVLETSYSVVATYYNVVRAKQQLRSIEESIRYNQERVAISETAFKSGAKPITDFLQAKIDLNEAMERALTQKIAILEAKRSLNLLLSRDSDFQFDVPDAISNGFVLDESIIFDRMKSNNTTILALKKQIEVNRLAFNEVKTNLLPTLSLNAGVGMSVSKNAAGTVTRSNALEPELTGRLSIPLFQAGEVARKKKVAALTVEASEVNLEKATSEILAVMQHAIDDYKHQKSLIDIEKDNNLLTKQLLEISIERLRLGQTTSLEVHQAHQNFVDSNTRLIDYQFALKLSETKLKQLIADL